MNTIVAQSEQFVTLDSETYAEIDPAYEVVTIHRGQHTGSDSDWGGQCIGSLPFDFLRTIVAALGRPEHDERCRLEDEPGYAESVQPWLY